MKLEIINESVKEEIKDVLAADKKETEENTLKPVNNEEKELTPVGDETHVAAVDEMSEIKEKQDKIINDSEGSKTAKEVVSYEDKEKHDSTLVEEKEKELIPVGDETHVAAVDDLEKNTEEVKKIIDDSSISKSAEEIVKFENKDLHECVNIKDRKELAKAILEAKKAGKEYKISRCLEEGYRYVFETFYNQEKLDEGLRFFRKGDFNLASRRAIIARQILRKSVGEDIERDGPLYAAEIFTKVENRPEFSDFRGRPYLSFENMPEDLKRRALDAVVDEVAKKFSISKEDAVRVVYLANIYKDYLFRDTYGVVPFSQSLKENDEETAKGAGIGGLAGLAVGGIPGMVAGGAIGAAIKALRCRGDLSSSDARKITNKLDDELGNKAIQASLIASNVHDKLSSSELYHDEKGMPILSFKSLPPEIQSQFLKDVISQTALQAGITEAQAIAVVYSLNRYPDTVFQAAIGYVPFKSQQGLEENILNTGIFTNSDRSVSERNKIRKELEARLTSKVVTKGLKTALEAIGFVRKENKYLDQNGNPYFFKNLPENLKIEFLKDTIIIMCDSDGLKRDDAIDILYLAGIFKDEWFKKAFGYVPFVDARTGAITVEEGLGLGTVDSFDAETGLRSRSFKKRNEAIAFAQTVREKGGKANIAVDNNNFTKVIYSIDPKLVEGTEIGVYEPFDKEKYRTEMAYKEREADRQRAHEIKLAKIKRDADEYKASIPLRAKALDIAKEQGTRLVQQTESLDEDVVYENYDKLILEDDTLEESDLQDRLDKKQAKIDDKMKKREFKLKNKDWKDQAARNNLRNQRISDLEYAVKKKELENKLSDLNAIGAEANSITAFYGSEEAKDRKDIKANLKAARSLEEEESFEKGFDKTVKFLYGDPEKIEKEKEEKSEEDIVYENLSEAQASPEDKFLAILKQDEDFYIDLTRDELAELYKKALELVEKNKDPNKKINIDLKLNIPQKAAEAIKEVLKKEYLYDAKELSRVDSTEGIDVFNKLQFIEKCYIIKAYKRLSQEPIADIVKFIRSKGGLKAFIRLTDSLQADALPDSVRLYLLSKADEIDGSGNSGIPNSGETLEEGKIADWIRERQLDNMAKKNQAHAKMSAENPGLYMRDSVAVFTAENPKETALRLGQPWDIEKEKAPKGEENIEDKKEKDIVDKEDIEVIDPEEVEVVDKKEETSLVPLEEKKKVDYSDDPEFQARQRSYELKKDKIEKDADLKDRKKNSEIKLMDKETKAQTRNQIRKARANRKAADDDMQAARARGIGKMLADRAKEDNIKHDPEHEIVADSSWGVKLPVEDKKEPLEESKKPSELTDEEVNAVLRTVLLSYVSSGIKLIADEKGSFTLEEGVKSELLSKWVSIIKAASPESFDKLKACVYDLFKKNYSEKVSPQAVLALFEGASESEDFAKCEDQIDIMLLLSREGEAYVEAFGDKLIAFNDSVQSIKTDKDDSIKESMFFPHLAPVWDITLSLLAGGLIGVTAIVSVAWVIGTLGEFPAIKEATGKASKETVEAASALVVAVAAVVKAGAAAITAAGLIAEEAFAVIGVVGVKTLKELRTVLLDMVDKIDDVGQEVVDSITEVTTLTWDALKQVGADLYNKFVDAYWVMKTKGDIKKQQKIKEKLAKACPTASLEDIDRLYDTIQNKHISPRESKEALEIYNKKRELIIETIQMDQLANVKAAKLDAKNASKKVDEIEKNQKKDAEKAASKDEKKPMPSRVADDPEIIDVESEDKVTSSPAQSAIPQIGSQSSQLPALAEEYEDPFEEEDRLALLKDFNLNPLSNDDSVEDDDTPACLKPEEVKKAFKNKVGRLTPSMPGMGSEEDMGDPEEGAMMAAAGLGENLREDFDKKSLEDTDKVIPEEGEKEMSNKFADFKSENKEAQSLFDQIVSLDKLDHLEFFLDEFDIETNEDLDEFLSKEDNRDWISSALGLGVDEGELETYIADDEPAPVADKSEEEDSSKIFADIEDPEPVIDDEEVNDEPVFSEEEVSSEEEIPEIEDDEPAPVDYDEEEPDLDEGIIGDTFKGAAKGAAGGAAAGAAAGGIATSPLAGIGAGPGAALGATLGAIGGGAVGLVKGVGNAIKKGVQKSQERKAEKENNLEEETLEEDKYYNLG